MNKWDWFSVFPSFRVLSHLDRLDVPKQGGVSPSVRFVLTNVDAAVALWCGAKQPSREPWSGSFEARTRPTPHVLPGNRCQIIACQRGQYGFVPYVLLSSLALSSRASIAPLFHLFTSDFRNFSVSVWCPTSGKCVFLPKSHFVVQWKANPARPR